MSSFFASFVVLGLFVALAFFYWNALVLEGDRARVRQWAIDWVGKGLLAPLVLWVIFNSGATPILPPFVDQVALGNIHGGWRQFLALTSPALLVISSYWAAISFVWLLPNLAERFENRRELLVLIAIWGTLMALPAGLIFMWGHWLWAGFAALVWLLPIIHSSPSLIADTPAKPIYASAIAKLKFGKYSEAENAIISELERFQDDFDGWLMLADIYANHFHDLPQAERTIRDLAAQPNTTPSEVSIAFHRLADWHLKLQRNPVAARNALREICERLRGTHLAHMANLRILQLPTSAEAMNADGESHKIRLPVVSESVDELDAPVELAPENSTEAFAKAKVWVKKLEQDPNDFAAREMLARIMAEQLGNPGAAIEQIKLLLGLPDQPDKKMAEWLSMIASWHIRELQDWDAGQKCLERIIHEYPQTSEAFSAQRRLRLREMEDKMRRFRPDALEARVLDAH